MTVEILTMCAFIAWTPASGDPEGHYFYEDDLFPIVAFNEQEEVCQPNGEWDVEHTYVVAGFNVDGIGPPSDPLTVVWPSEPVPEPDGVWMLLAGWVLLHGLFYWRQHGKDK